MSLFAVQLCLTGMILAVWVCRYASLPNGASAKREWHKLVMVIEGPNEPTVMDAFLEPLVDDLDRLAPPKPVSSEQQPPAQAQPSSAQGDCVPGAMEGAGS